MRRRRKKKKTNEDIGQKKPIKDGIIEYDVVDELLLDTPSKLITNANIQLQECLHDKTLDPCYENFTVKYEPIDTFHVDAYLISKNKEAIKLDNRRNFFFHGCKRIQNFDGR